LTGLLSECVGARLRRRHIDAEPILIGIFYTDGSYTEVEGASAGLDDDDHLICWDDHGTVVGRLPADTILAYGRADVTRALAEGMSKKEPAPGAQSIEL
jgi:hypothetical protein